MFAETTLPHIKQHFQLVSQPNHSSLTYICGGSCPSPWSNLNPWILANSTMANLFSVLRLPCPRWWCRYSVFNNLKSSLSSFDFVCFAPVCSVPPFSTLLHCQVLRNLSMQEFSSFFKPVQLNRSSSSTTSCRCDHHFSANPSQHSSFDSLQHEARSVFFAVLNPKLEPPWYGKSV